MITFLNTLLNSALLIASFVIVAYGAALCLIFLAEKINRSIARSNNIRRSVALGWNTGMPAEGQWVLVSHMQPRHGIFELLGQHSTINQGVFQRRGNELVSQTGGLRIPVSSAKGWLAVIGNSIAVYCVKYAASGDDYIHSLHLTEEDAQAEMARLALSSDPCWKIEQRVVQTQV